MALVELAGEGGGPVWCSTLHWFRNGTMVISTSPYFMSHHRDGRNTKSQSIAPTKGSKDIAEKWEEKSSPIRHATLLRNEMKDRRYYFMRIEPTKKGYCGTRLWGLGIS